MGGNLDLNDNPMDPNDGNDTGSESGTGTGYTGPLQSFSGSPNPIILGQSITFSATFDPTWSGVVYDESYPNTTFPILSGGTASVPTTHTGSINYVLKMSKAGEIDYYAFQIITVNAAPTPDPSIASFTAASSTIVQGQSTSITAVFANGTASIQPNSLTPISGTPITVSPNATTTYVLSVTGNGQTITQSLTITVTPYVPPVGLTAALSASPSEIAYGASSTLTPTFTGGTGSIDNGIGPVTSGIGVSVSPVLPTYYTLTVTPASGTPITAQTLVIVDPAPLPPSPSISSFTAVPSSIYSGQSATLLPVFNGGGGITGSINQGVGAVLTGGSYTVSPTITTTYRLTVTCTGGPNDGQTTYQDVTITVSSSGSSNTQYVTTTWTYPSLAKQPLGFEAAIARRSSAGVFNFNDSSTYLFPIQKRTADKDKNVVFTLELPNQNQIPLKTAIRTVYEYGKSSWVESPLVVLFQTNGPFIDVQPVNTSFLSGNSATLTLSAVGTGTLSYSWNRVGAGVIPNTNFPSYTTDVEGTYYCRVINTVSGNTYSTVSSNAIVALNNPPTITQQPTGGILAYVGDAITMSVVATGSGILSYQWYVNDFLIVGQTQPTIITGTNGTYICKVFNNLYNTQSYVNSNAAVISGGNNTAGSDPTDGKGNPIVLDLVF